MSEHITQPLTGPEVGAEGVSFCTASRPASILELSGELGLPPLPPARFGGYVRWGLAMATPIITHPDGDIDVSPEMIDGVMSEFVRLTASGYCPPMRKNHEPSATRTGHLLKLQRWVDPADRRLKVLVACEFSEPDAEAKIQSGVYLYLSMALGRTTTELGEEIGPTILEMSVCDEPYHKRLGPSHILKGNKMAKSAPSAFVTESDGGHFVRYGEEGTSTTEAFETPEMAEAIRDTLNAQFGVEGDDASEASRAAYVARLEREASAKLASDVEEDEEPVAEEPPAEGGEEEEEEDEKANPAFSATLNAELKAMRLQLSASTAETAELKRHLALASFKSHHSAKVGMTLELTSAQAEAWFLIHSKLPAVFSQLTGELKAPAVKLSAVNGDANALAFVAGLRQANPYGDVLGSSSTAQAFSAESATSDEVEAEANRRAQLNGTTAIDELEMITFGHKV